MCDLIVCVHLFGAVEYLYFEYKFYNSVDWHEIIVAILLAFMSVGD